jgi:trans-2,3-dihydro-3-hydroxyanthranilate isomerase
MSSRRRPTSSKTHPSTTGSGSSSGRRGTSSSTTELRYTLLDVFTDVAFTGNPLAVVHDADGVDDRTMLAFAHETRLSETTFVQSSTEAGADYRNRIFSMAGELPFAGHPSLGTAVAVARANDVVGEVSYVQQTGAGLQPISVSIDGPRARAAMLQEPPQFGDEVDPGPILAALRLDREDAHPELPAQIVSTGLPHIMMPLASLAALERIAPDAAAVDRLLAEIEPWGIYAAWCEPERGKARTRMFGHSAQLTEDPATGSAAGPLCAYLHTRTGVRAVEIRQGVEIGRPSRLDAEIAADRVRVGGDVVAVIDGALRLEG